MIKKFGNLNQKSKQGTDTHVNLFYLFIFLKLITFTFLAQFLLPSASQALPTPLCPTHPSTPPPCLFKKGQAFHGHQQNITYQVVVRLSTSPGIKTLQENSA